MPRYFFHLREGALVTRDEEGRDLKNLQTARAVAVMSARDIMCGEVLLGRVSLGDAIEVEDESGRKLFDVPFSQAVDFTR